MKQLRRVSKEAKESLSFQIESYNVNVKNVNFIDSGMKFILQLDINDTDVNVKISQSNFNQFCEDLFDKAMKMVEKALRTAKISAEQIDNVVILLLKTARLICFSPNMKLIDSGWWISSNSKNSRTFVG